MYQRCVDCNEKPRLRDLGSCYLESFPVTTDGAQALVTLRLCLRCGARFVDRLQLREYLRARLPKPVVEYAQAMTLAR